MIKFLFILIFFALDPQVIISQEKVTKELTLALALNNNSLMPIMPVGAVKSIEPFNLVNGKWVGSHLINYNPDKSKIEEVLFRDTGNVFRKSVYSIDSNRKLTHWDLYEADGSHSGTKTIYKYNKDGQIVEAIHHLLNSLSYKENFSYLDKNRIEVIRQFDSHPNDPSKEIYIFNDLENIKEVVFIDEDVKGKETYKYDKKGLPITYSLYSRSGSLMRRETYRYEFDKKGNWIKSIRTEYDFDKSKSERKSDYAIKRKITYY